MKRPVTFSFARWISARSINAGLAFCMAGAFAHGLSARAADREETSLLVSMAEKGDLRIESDNADFTSVNRRQESAYRFNAHGVQARNREGVLQLRFTGYGREGRWNEAQAAQLSHSENGIEYRHGDATEWYVNRPDGLEQGFTIERSPEGTGELRVDLASTGDFHARTSDGGREIVWSRNQTAAMAMRGLAAWDAQGRALSARFELKESHLQMVVNDRAARYPVVIDPTLQQAKLSALDGSPGDYFGYSVAVNGTTAIVGAFGKGQFTGAAYIFVQNGTQWTEQAKLTASDGTTFNNFGSSVALSGDTAIVGASQNAGSIGAAYIFVRSGTTWTQQIKLLAYGGVTGDEFGYSVSIDGNRAAIGAPGANNLNGAAYVFIHIGGTWKQRKKLVASDGAPFDDFGSSVAVSGPMVVAGARFNLGVGAAYVFVTNGTVWSQQAKLTALDGSTNDQFGDAVALDGTTALIGAYNNANGLGAAYVFLQSGGVWAFQTKLVPPDGLAGDNFGSAVAINGDLAAIGAPFRSATSGAAYQFVRSGTTWTEEAEIISSDETQLDEFGASVSVSGPITIVSSPFKSVSLGSAYIFNTPLLSLAPNAGPAGTSITLSGTGFAPNETVNILWASPHTYLGAAITDVTGSFSGFAATVPAGSATGLNVTYAQGATAKDLATGYFTVQ